MKTKDIVLSYKLMVFILLLSAAVSWGTQSVAEEWTTEQKEVWKMEEFGWELWKKKDLDGYMKLFHEDCVIWHYRAEEPLEKASEREFISSRIGITVDKLKPLAIKVFGNVAVVHYYARWDIISKYSWGRVSRTWLKHDGKWQIISNTSASCEFPLNCPR